MKEDYISKMLLMETKMMIFVKQTKLIMEYWLLSHINCSFNHIIILILLRPKGF